MATENTVNIFVELDLEAKYQVQLNDENGASGRNQEADSGDRINWKKRDAGDAFSIIRLEGDESVFTEQDVDGNGQQLSVTFIPDKPPGHDTKYPYNLVVMGPDGSEHDTKATAEAGSNVPMDLGRPVIRN